MSYQLTLISRNRKTGPIPTSTSHKGTCPNSCKLKNNGCYAALSFVGIHWAKVSKGERGTDFKQFTRQIAALGKGALWRHNVAGDLVGSNNEIDFDALKLLVRANKKKRGFSYTHYPRTISNIAKLAYANFNGFTISLSCEGIDQASDVFKRFGLPVVAIVPEDQPKVTIHNGVKTIICPAQTSSKVTCKTCQLCQNKDRGYVIGFRAHGCAKKKAQSTIEVLNLT